MKKLGFAACALVAAFLIAPAAQAGSIYEITYSSSAGVTLDTVVEASYDASSGGEAISAIDSFSYTYGFTTYTSATFVPTYGYVGDGLIYPNDTYSYSTSYNGSTITGTSDLDWGGCCFNCRLGRMLASNWMPRTASA